MVLKLLSNLLILSQNQEVVYTTTKEISHLEKENNLANLITILTIFGISITVLLIINMVKNYKLSKKIRSLEAELK